MSDLKQRQKLLRQAKIEAQTLRVLIKSRNLLIRSRWFNNDQKKGDVCAQMVISEAGSVIQNALDRQVIVTKAFNLILAEATTKINKWVSIPHWNDAQKYKKDVLKVFDTTIHNLQKKLQPV